MPLIKLEIYSASVGFIHKKCVGLHKKLSSTRKLNDGDNYHHTSQSKLHMVETVLPALSHQQARLRKQGVAMKNQDRVDL